MTSAHLAVTIYAGMTWALIVALFVRGVWLLDPIWATLDIIVAILAFWCHSRLQPYERFADEY